LAGNIAIVHGVTGSSRTFMGEEAAGVDAARIALARIAAGQSDIALIGGSQNGERSDLLVLYEFGDFNLKDKFVPVWARPERRLCAWFGGRLSRHRIQAHAEARGAKPYARLTNVVADLARRKRPGEVTATLEKLWSETRRLLETRAPHHRRDRRRPRHIGRAGVSRRSTRIRGAGHRDDVRSHHGDAVSAGPRTCGAFDLARRIVSPNDPTGVEVEMSASPTRLWSSGPAIGGARAWLWSSDQVTRRWDERGNMTAARDKSGRPIVVVTGMGVVTSLGAGKKDNWTRLTPRIRDPDHHALSH